MSPTTYSDPIRAARDAALNAATPRHEAAKAISVGLHEIAQCLAVLPPGTALMSGADLARAALEIAGRALVLEQRNGAEPHIRSAAVSAVAEMARKLAAAADAMPDADHYAAARR